MVKELRHGEMVDFMKDTGLMVNNMEEEDFSKPLAMFMRVNGMMGRQMEKENS
jgi:hypothetical protein